MRAVRLVNRSIFRMISDEDPTLRDIDFQMALLSNRDSRMEMFPTV